MKTNEEKIQIVINRYARNFERLYTTGPRKYPLKITWPRSKNIHYTEKVYNDFVDYLTISYDELVSYCDLQIRAFNNIYKQVDYKETIEILGKEIVEDKLLR